MDIQDLRIFTRVAAIQNLSSVGHEFALTPGTISRRLQSLEDELGVRLFVRSTRSIRITEEGSIFLGHAGASSFVPRPFLVRTIWLWRSALSHRRFRR